MKKILQTLSSIIHNKSNLIQVVFLLVILLACSWSLLIPGLGSGHDLNHQARIFEMAGGLKEGVFPVIWSENLGFGFGMPLFEFYAPLPYFFGAVWYIIGFNLTDSVKLMMLFANILTVLGAYFLGKEIFKDNWAAILTSIAISLAPYRAVDMYIRTAVSEGWAIGFLCVLLLGITQVVNHKKFGWLVITVSFAGLLLSHNLTALMALPFLIIFGLSYVFIQHNNWPDRWSTLIRLFFSGLLGLGISAFYFVPVLLEKNFTQVDTFTLSSYYDFRQHFLYLRQFIEPWGEWEYGGSGWGPNDEMSYFLGFGQLLGFLAAFTPFIWLLKKSKNKLSKLRLHSLLIILALTALAMTLLKVQKIWELFPFTAYFQFPWRFLSVALIFGGLVIGSSYMFLSKGFKLLYFSFMLILLIAINPRYFRSEKYEDHTAKYEQFETEIRTQTSTNLFDYLPKDIVFLKRTSFYVGADPTYKEIAVPADSLFKDAEIRALNPSISTNQSIKKVFSIKSDEPVTVTLNLAFYPGWTVSTREQILESGPDKYGLLSFEVPAGEQEITVKLEDTPLRFWTKVISVASVLVLISWLIKNLFTSKKGILK